jgi:hypothetical protein
MEWILYLIEMTLYVIKMIKEMITDWKIYLDERTKTILMTWLASEGRGIERKALG